MDVWLIANVGQRDLQLDGRPLDAKRLRAEGARIEAEYETLQARLSAPMLSAALDYVRTRHDGAQVRVLLTATDQADARFREGDTVTCAGVLKRLLAERFGGLLAKTQVRTTAEKPNLYDRMLHYYETRGLDHLAPTGERYYLLLAGGTPAANTALLLAGIRRFWERAIALSVGEGSAAVRPMDVGPRIMASYRRDRVQELLDRRDFSGAATLLGVESAAGRVAAAAAKRLNLDFEPSERMLEETLRESGGRTPAALDDLYEEARRLAAKERRAIIRELYWNALVKWRREEYADFLGRVWRLREATLQESVGRACGLDLTNKIAAQSAFEQWVRAQPGLPGHVCANSKRPAPRIELEAWCLIAVLGWLAQQHAADGPLAACYHAACQLDKLSSLRNSSVIAHGFTGLSRETVLRAMETPEESNLLDCLAALLEVWGVSPGVDPYAQFADAVAQLMCDA